MKEEMQKYRILVKGREHFIKSNAEEAFIERVQSLINGLFEEYQEKQPRLQKERERLLVIVLLNLAARYVECADRRRKLEEFLNRINEKLSTAFEDGNTNA